MTGKRRLLLVAGLAGAAALALAGALVSERETAATSPAPVAAPAVASKPAAETAPSLAPAPNALQQGHAVATPTGTPTLDDVLMADVPNEVLVAGLDASDPVVVAEAANALVGRGALSAVDALVAFDVIGKPRAAPSVVYALGRLGAMAEPEQRQKVVERLLALMAEEKARGAQESQGNLLQIYEALGDTGDAMAVAPLERELLDPTVRTAPKVVIVQALVALRAQQSRATLEALAAQLAPLATGSDFEAELRRDLLAAIRQALVQLI